MWYYQKGFCQTVIILKKKKLGKFYIEKGERERK